MTTLGKIEKINDLRSIWPHEAHDFSRWLAMEENLSLLSESIGIDIDFEERESSIGSFNVDILAKETGTDRKIVIENQLENTDHDHLGKIITYASGKDAEVIIWIVKRARDEHKQAIEWLNRCTDEKIGFFLVEIELWKINDSLPAPKFNVVERPNDWAKTMKTVEGLSDTEKLHYEFWQEFSEYAASKTEFTKVFSIRKPRAQSWYSLSAGSSIYNINVSVGVQKKQICAEIYISDDKELFAKFQEKKEEIEGFLGSKVEWKEAKKACRIFMLKKGDIKIKKETWPEYFDWMISESLKLREVLRKYAV